ncbi:hypothetical protein ACIPSE_45530 [Streptomyces sp. NPDC090106]|uniref:hypothetical protein n=1 Tax=Streptomyces sp. NPDC090106 TaxID=3365946 RepID=UPI003823D480
MATTKSADDETALAEGMWRATDLLQAYLSEDPVRVLAGLEGLNVEQLTHTLGWQIVDHDILFEDLGEPSMSASLLDQVAALAPLECEFMMTTAVRRAVAAGTGLIAGGLDEFPLDAQIHALTVLVAVMLLRAHGRDEALRFVAASAADFVRRGHPRPYPAP